MDRDQFDMGRMTWRLGSRGLARRTRNQLPRLDSPVESAFRVMQRWVQAAPGLDLDDLAQRAGRGKLCGNAVGPHPISEPE